MPVRTLLPSFAASLHKEAAYPSFVSLVVGLFSLHSFKQLVLRCFSIGDGPLILSRQRQLVLFFGPVQEGHLAFRHGLLGFFFRDSERCIPHLHGQIVLKVQEAGLAHVFGLGTRLADFRLFVPCSSTRFPSEHRERTRAYLAFGVVVCFGHPDERIRSQARFAQDWEIASFPSVFFDVSTCSVRHLHTTHSSKAPRTHVHVSASLSSFFWRPTRHERASNSEPNHTNSNTSTTASNGSRVPTDVQMRLRIFAIRFDREKRGWIVGDRCTRRSMRSMGARPPRRQPTTTRRVRPTKHVDVRRVSDASPSVVASSMRWRKKSRGTNGSADRPRHRRCVRDKSDTRDVVTAEEDLENEHLIYIVKTKPRGLVVNETLY